MEATFERPVKAKLMVVTEGGESWDATAADLSRFGLHENVADDAVENVVATRPTNRRARVYAVTEAVDAD